MSVSDRSWSLYPLQHWVCLCAHCSTICLRLSLYPLQQHLCLRLSIYPLRNQLCLRFSSLPYSYFCGDFVLSFHAQASSGLSAQDSAAFHSPALFFLFSLSSLCSPITSWYPNFAKALIPDCLSLLDYWGVKLGVDCSNCEERKGTLLRNSNLMLGRHRWPGDVLLRSQLSLKM